MQKLGLALSLPTIKRIAFSPPLPQSLIHWFMFQWGIESDENAAGAVISPPHATSGALGLGVGNGTMVQTDKVSKWKDVLNPTTFDATQTTSVDKPEFNTRPGVLPSPPPKPNIFFDGTSYLNMSSDVSIAANQDFTIMMHVEFTNLTARALIGASANNFFRVNAADGFRCKIGGAGNQNFIEASDVITIEKDYFVTLTRQDGAAGRLTCHVHDTEGVYEDKTWGSTSNTDADAFTINNIGAAADDANNFKGVYKNLFVYQGVALNAAERKQLYIYCTSLL